MCTIERMPGDRLERLRGAASSAGSGPASAYEGCVARCSASHCSLTQPRGGSAAAARARKKPRAAVTVAVAVTRTPMMISICAPWAHAHGPPHDDGRSTGARLCGSAHRVANRPDRVPGRNCRGRRKRSPDRPWTRARMFPGIGFAAELKGRRGWGWQCTDCQRTVQETVVATIQVRDVAGVSRSKVTHCADRLTLAVRPASLQASDCFDRSAAESPPPHHSRCTHAEFGRGKPRRSSICPKVSTSRSENRSRKYL